MYLQNAPFSSLACRDFRLYLMGQSLALMGLWTKRVAMGWLVFRLTGSGFLLGLVECLNYAPIVFIGALAGAWLDRHDLRKTLLITQFLCLIQALLLAVLCLTETVTFLEVAFLGFFLGLVNAVDMPCRQSSVSHLVDTTEKLKSAIAMNSVVFNLSRLLGPMAAGFLIHFCGEGVCFLVAAALYLPILILLTFIIHYRGGVPPSRTQSLVRDMREGLAYVRETLILRKLIVLLLWASILAMNYPVLFPMFTTQVFHGDAKLLGFLFSGVGMGAILGVVSLTLWIHLREIPRALVGITGVTIAGMLLFSMTTSAALAVLLATCMGFGIITTNVGINTILQTVAEESKRSRVVSLYTMCAGGIGPCSGLILGCVADLWGPQTTMTACAACLGVALLCYARDSRRVTRDLREALSRPISMGR